MFRSDIWRPAIVSAPLEALLAGEALRDVTWFPEQDSFRFLADPFGLWRDGKLYVFAEAYDYRVRIGTIDVLTFDSALNPLDRRQCLAEPWHLSYPILIEDEGETYMLPEAWRSGRLTLYRAADFPHRWEPCGTIDLEVIPVDATPVKFEGRWWLFYSAAGKGTPRNPSLHVAFADRLQGPWTPHPLNPVRSLAESSRPGGTPVVINGKLVLPVQDCSRTYGGAIRALTIERLTTETFEASADDTINAPPSFAPYIDGLHTMAAAGPVTLIDAKRIDRSPARLLINLGRSARRFRSRYFQTARG